MVFVVSTQKQIQQSSKQSKNAEKDEYFRNMSINKIRLKSVLLFIKIIKIE